MPSLLSSARAQTLQYQPNSAVGVASFHAFLLTVNHISMLHATYSRVCVDVLGTNWCSTYKFNVLTNMSSHAARMLTQETQSCPVCKIQNACILNTADKQCGKCLHPAFDQSCMRPANIAATTHLSGFSKMTKPKTKHHHMR